VDTADAIARFQPGVERERDAGLREMEYGTLEGQSMGSEAVQVEMKAIAAAWRSGQSDVVVGGAGGESPAMVAARMSAALARLLAGRAQQTVLVVCHSHAIKALLAEATGMGLSKIHDIPQRNCAINVIDCCAAADEPAGATGHQVHGVDLVCPTAPKM